MIADPHDLNKANKLTENIMPIVQLKLFRKDSVTDHLHMIADGSDSGGMLAKPSGLHSHLYENEGRTLETGLAKDTLDHFHDAVGGHTSGPMPVKNKTLS